MNRTAIKFGGQSGQGINISGEILSKTLLREGYNIFAYREYPSLITGGVASYQVDISDKEIKSSSRYSNILLTATQDSFNEYLPSLTSKGLLIHDLKDLEISQEQNDYIKTNDIEVIYLDTKKITEEAKAPPVMTNVAALGFLWKILDLDVENLIDTIFEMFKEKNVDLEAEERCVHGGYNAGSFRAEYRKRISIPNKAILRKRKLLMSGNDAISLGAISAGLRAYYAYPMTPSTSIFQFLGNTAKETGILVKQAENEITAVQMALGSMHMGTRAMVATAGGGFDLMIETISCAGMSETPLVVVLAQRVGPGTGVPTWTGAGDINTAVKGGHGEFPRCVIAISDIESAYTQIQKAFNIAEKYQIPVIVLSEKQISESLFTIPKLPEAVKIERGFSDGEYRYEITDTGVSPRWRPSKEKEPYLSTSDEHTIDGTDTEDSRVVIAMSEKRIRKLQHLKEELPEPKLYGSKNASTIFVGWGSVKNPMTDLIDEGLDIAYLHYEYIYPLKTKLFTELIQTRRLVLVENNQTGQLGSLLREETGYDIEDRILKYDARPFFREDISDYIGN